MFRRGDRTHIDTVRVREISVSGRSTQRTGDTVPSRTAPVAYVQRELSWYDRRIISPLMILQSKPWERAYAAWPADVTVA